jgi:putative transposase
LSDLASQVAAQFEHLSRISYETVRRWLKQAKIVYRRAKGWIISPDVRYELKKHQRDRLLRIARQASDGVAVWLDESWFVRWPYWYRTWAEQGKSLTVLQRWSEKVDTTALFAALDDESQQSLLYWAQGQPNSDEMIVFLEKLTTHYTAQGKRFIALFWDKASWHTSKKTRDWIRAYNQKAKQAGLPRLLVSYHPTRSPWLMPLESVFCWVKHQVLGGRVFQTIPELQQAVALAFQQRVAQAKKRHDKAVATFLAAAAQKSTSVM